MKANDPTIGIIGGSGLYELEGLTDVRWRRVCTPFGAPSECLLLGGSRAARDLPCRATSGPP